MLKKTTVLTRPATVHLGRVGEKVSFFSILI